jgi:hypothetical protein
MKAKALLLTAVSVAAGVFQAMAQSNVYSMNIVGYVDLTIQPGYNLISVPLQSSDTNNDVNTVLTNTSSIFPAGDLLFTWDPVNARYADPLQAGGDGNWYGPFFNFYTQPLPPGMSFFLQNTSGTNITMTLVGTVLTGSNSYFVNAGYGFYGDFVPQSNDITTTGLPITDNSLIYTWDVVHQRYNPAFIGLGTNDSAFDGSGNLLGTPGTNPVLTSDFLTRSVYTPAIGEGFIYSNPGSAKTWAQNFTVN